jgi:F-type H+-transporting ATPase subunit epsilon
MKLKIITPEKLILEKEIVSLTVPTSSGEITILPGHTDLLSTLSLGNVTYRENDNSNEQLITIESGVLTTDGKTIKILADTAINSESINEEKVQELKARAQELIKNAPSDRSIEKLKSQVRVSELHLSSKKRRKI